MSKKPGRNEPCPCGSVKKYKKCCGRDGSGDVNPAEGLLLRDEDMTGTPLDEYMTLLPFLAIHEQKIIQFEPGGTELKKVRNFTEKRYRPGEDDVLMDSHFISWLYFDLRFGKNRKTIVEHFLDDPLASKLADLLDDFDRIQDSGRSPQPKIDIDRLRRMLGLPSKSN